MRAKILRCSALIVVLLFLVPVAIARSQTQAYAAGNGALNFYGLAPAGGPSVGGARFDVFSSDTTAAFSVTGGPAVVDIEFEEISGAVVGRFTFCAPDSGPIPVPADSWTAVVFVGADATNGVVAGVSCDAVTPPAAGSITATFTRE